VSFPDTPKPATAGRGGQIICERDDGLFQIGLGDDAPGPFPSRQFALSVTSGHLPAPATVTKFRRVLIREVRRDG